MAEISIRELRNHGGDVVDRAAHGEHITITHAGKPVAELSPVARPGLTAEALLARWASLPALDPQSLKSDIDTVLDPGL